MITRSRASGRARSRPCTRLASSRSGRARRV